VRVALLAGFLVLLLPLAACGNDSGIPPLTHTASSQIPPNTLGTVTAHCGSGEQLVGGGVSANYANSGAVVASYPSAADAWTVSASSPDSAFELQAYAYCLQPSMAVAVQVVQAQRSGESAIAICPSGAVLTSGGYTGGAARSSYPTIIRADPTPTPAPFGEPSDSHPTMGTGIGWTSDVPGAKQVTTYALCATRGLTASQIAFTSSTFGLFDSGNVHCPTNEQLVTGGGFHVFDIAPVIPLAYDGLLDPSNPRRGWEVRDTGALITDVSSLGTGPAPFEDEDTVYVVCLTAPA
jgi:hypothetical protein